MTGRLFGAAIVVWASLFVACSKSDRVFVEAPDLGDARGVVVVVHEPTGPRALAIDLTVEEPWRIEAAYDDGADVDVDLLLYDCDLGSWLIAAADLGLVKSDGKSVPEPSRVLSASSDDGFEWRPGAVIPERTQLLEFDYTTPTRCSEMTVEDVVPFGATEDGRLLIPLDEDRVIAGLRLGLLYEVHRDGTSQRIFEGARSHGSPYFGGFASTDGTVYLLSGGRSCLARVDTSTITEIACLPATATTSDGNWFHVDGDMTPDGLEAFAMTDDGRTFVLHPGATTFEDITPEGADTGGRKAAVKRTGPGTALFAGPLDIEVQRYAGGRSEIESVGLSSFDRVNGLGWSPTYGALLVTNLGDVLRRQTDGAWRLVGSTGIAQARFAIDIDGRIIAGGSGIAVEIGADGAACDAGVTLSEDIDRLAKIGPDRFVALMRPKRAQPEIHFVRVTGERPPTCD